MNNLASGVYHLLLSKQYLHERILWMSKRGITFLRRNSSITDGYSTHFMLEMWESEMRNHIFFVKKVDPPLSFTFDLS